jgi:hypothetical protein
MTEIAEIAALPEKPVRRTKPIIVMMIVMCCIGGAMAITVPIGFIFWMNDQYKLASATQSELAKKASQVMVLGELPDGFGLAPPTFSISHNNQGAALFQSPSSTTSYYFEKKDASKLGAVQKRMVDATGLGDHFTVKERGELPVAGKTLVYARGISQRDTGTLYNELHGYIRVNDKTLVEVATGTTDARPLDMNEFQRLLGAIKSFTP